MSELSFEDLQSALGDIKTYDRYFIARCVFHDDSSPSMLVFRDGWFRCLGCGRHGTWKTLWNKVKGQPVQIMPERSSMWGTPDISFDRLEDVCYQAHMDLTHFPSLGWYLEMRGVDGRIESNELGYYDGWYTIPVRDDDYEFETAVLRAAPHIQEATNLRFWSPSKPKLFVPDWKLFKEEPYTLVVFGMFDALYLSQLRYPVCTSTGGKDSFDSRWLEEHRKKVYILPDLGEELVIHHVGNRTEFGTGTPYRLAAELGWRAEVVLLDFPEGCKDANDFYTRGHEGNLISQLGELR